MIGIYRLVGMVVVYALSALVALGLLATAAGATILAWHKGWLWASEKMWEGHDYTNPEDYPPLWKLRIAGVTLALSKFQFRKIPAVYREAEEIANDEKTLKVWAKELYK